MVILFVILFRKHIHRFPPAYFRPFPWVELKNLMKVGLPSAGEQLSYSSSQVVITYFINMLGVEALATRTYVSISSCLLICSAFPWHRAGDMHRASDRGEETAGGFPDGEICNEEVGDDNRDSVLYSCSFRACYFRLADVPMPRL